MTVFAGNSTDDIPLNCKYCTWLTVELVTEQLRSAVTVLFGYLMLKTVEIEFKPNVIYDGSSKYIFIIFTYLYNRIS